MAKILVVDDEEQIRNMLKQILTRAGYDVVLANDGGEGLKLYRNSPADLVISDITMPGTDGLAMLDNLRNEFASLKVIVISGGGQRFPDYFLPKAKEKGALAVLKKPFSREELLAEVTKALGQKDY